MLRLFCEPIFKNLLFIIIFIRQLLTMYLKLSRYSLYRLSSNSQRCMPLKSW